MPERSASLDTPWSEDFQVEQDLIISRALVEMFSDTVLSEGLAFRGGTALYKLYLTPPARYSEDIDLVQVAPGPAGPVTRAMFERSLAGKLGDPQFGADMSALLRQGYEWRPAEAARTVSERLISLLPGEPWKGGWMDERA